MSHPIVRSIDPADHRGRIQLVTSIAPEQSTSPTERFRRQHEELASLSAEILERVAAPAAELAADAGHVRRLVARFAGKLAVHASMENEALYPRLLAHRDPEVRAKATALFDEVGALYASFGGYRERWPTIDAIERDPAAFAKDTRRVLKVLWSRMMRENDELYPLVDGADD